MTDKRESALKFYSIGIVAQDKERTTDIIEVYPVEELPMIDGSIRDYAQQYDVSLNDSSGVPRRAKVEAKATIRAKWLPFGQSNRITAPDVIRNESVILFRLSDNDDYHWTTIFREPSIRRLETVAYMYGDLTEPLKEWGEDSSYWAKVSTHDKYIQIHTAKSDGEPFIYDVIINAGEGYVQIQDDVGNFIRLDSANTYIKVCNADDTFLDLNQSNSYEHADELICKNTQHFKVNAPDITLGGPGSNSGGNINSTVGYSGCTVSGAVENEHDYHDREFVHLCHALDHARIGNEYRSYTHYDQDDMFSYCNQTMTQISHYKIEQTASKLQNTNTNIINTDTHEEYHNRATIKVAGDNPFRPVGSGVRSFLGGLEGDYTLTAPIIAVNAEKIRINTDTHEEYLNRATIKVAGDNPFRPVGSGVRSFLGGLEGDYTLTAPIIAVNAEEIRMFVRHFNFSNMGYGSLQIPVFPTQLRTFDPSVYGANAGDMDFMMGPPPPEDLAYYASLGYNVPYATRGVNMKLIGSLTISADKGGAGIDIGALAIDLKRKMTDIKPVLAGLGATLPDSWNDL